MQAIGAELRELATLSDAGHLRPLIDQTFAFDQTLEALAYKTGVCDCRRFASAIGPIQGCRADDAAMGGRRFPRWCLSEPDHRSADPPT
jgi:Zinc-binding dehydrogenase